MPMRLIEASGGLRIPHLIDEGHAELILHRVEDVGVITFPRKGHARRRRVHPPPSMIVLPREQSSTMTEGSPQIEAAARREILPEPREIGAVARTRNRETERQAPL